MHQRMATLSIPFLRGRVWNFDRVLFSVGCWILLALIVGLVLYPVVLVFLGSFRTEIPGQETSFGFDAWRAVFSEPTLLKSVWNTLALVAARQAIAFPIAILVAWVLGRTDIPGSKRLEFLFWIAFFLPSVPVLLGWILLLDPDYGLVNHLITLLPFVEKGPFNIYSFWGIVWVHLVTNTIAVKVMLLTPAFRNMDTTLEDASGVCGAGRFRTLIHVTLPVMTPVLVVTLLLGIINALQAFEIELILGSPIRLFVFSTEIWFLIRQEPPLFSHATALSSTILILMIPLILMQRWLITRRRFTTITGQFQSQKIKLRGWKWPIFGLVLALGLLLTAVPSVFLVLGTFMRLFGFFRLENPFTTGHWIEVLQDTVFIDSFLNTVLLAAGTAVTAVVLCTLVAYVVTRTRFSGRSALDFISWLPATLPGIILGLGFLWMVLGNPFLVPLYGSLIVMMIALLIDRMTLAIQIIKSYFVQLGFDLEEAGRVSGGSWWYTFRHVLLPPLIPVLLLVGAMSFAGAARNVSTVALLATSDTRPISLLQVDYMIEGYYEAGAVVGVIIVIMTSSAAFVARLFGQRNGLDR